MDWFKENAFTPCTLGDSIFRSETVPLVVLSIMPLRDDVR